jgi:tetratricopeptide (TPR) repeat protein
MRPPQARACPTILRDFRTLAVLVLVSLAGGQQAGNADADAFLRQGLTKHLQNRYDEAAQEFERAVQLNPQMWAAHLFLGIDCYRMNRFQKAQKELEISDRLHPDQEETRFWLGATYIAQHQEFRGLKVLEGLVRKQPGNVEALRLLAETYASYGSELVTRVAERYPDTAAGLEAKGEAYEFDGSLREALEAYRAALAKDPQRGGLQDAIARVRGELSR